LYLFFFLYSTFTPITHGETILSQPLHLSLRVQWSINIFIRPWTSFPHYGHGLGLTLFSSDQWRPLLSLGRIRGIVFASDSPRHDTGIHKVEVVPPLSVRKGGAMVHWHCKKCKWWLGQTLR
jgi:hypothetical protein